MTKLEKKIVRKTGETSVGAQKKNDDEAITAGSAAHQKRRNEIITSVKTLAINQLTNEG